MSANRVDNNVTEKKPRGIDIPVLEKGRKSTSSPKVITQTWAERSSPCDKSQVRCIPNIHIQDKVLSLLVETFFQTFSCECICKQIDEFESFI